MDLGWRILNEKMIQPAKARTDQARDEMSKNRFLQDSFRLATQIYRCRGYAGTIFVSGQFGVYTESVSITIALANARCPGVYQAYSRPWSVGSVNPFSFLTHVLLPNNRHI